MKIRKQKSYKKLELHRETLRHLDAADLGLVVGGTTSVDDDCEPSQTQCPDVQTTGV